MNLKNLNHGWIKPLLFLCCLLVFLEGIRGQAELVSVKFDEITRLADSGADDSDLRKRFDRFIEAAKREKLRIPYVLHYRARIREGSHSGSSSYWAESLKWRLGRDDLLILDGGVKELETLELWFKSPTGDLPKPTPEFERSEAIDCPSVYAWRDDFEFDKKKPVKFRARVYPESDVDLKWTVSGGVIVAGDTARVVTVDVSEVEAERITAYVQVVGLPKVCKDTAVADAQIGPRPRLLDRFGALPNGDIRARLDNFLATLANNPDTHGNVYVYGDRGTGRLSVDARRRLLENHFRFRKFDPARITIRDAGYRETVSTDLWIVPKGVAAPNPSPTVDSSFVNRRTSTRSRVKRR